MRVSLQCCIISIVQNCHASHKLEVVVVDAAAADPFLLSSLLSYVRYIVASPTAKYNEPTSVFDAPCDVAFLCAKPEELIAEDVERLVANGCKTVVDGAYRPVSSAVAKVQRKLPFSNTCEKNKDCAIKTVIF